ncbi:hypothetical protein PtrSN002B_002802 [Pyrenophora tritici-repentis]|uniref:Uncharacterized protein n=2 Tax=Pyrenophora tritici-repentis TaxID=45151 RepID=A0A2W1FUS7_9PLEO|nr:uncharacterized protein PTRG_03906 [Pyrenophora tritici-repentis Pt-1C-BFP]KAF7448189.1 hypothetical protein A1F99_075530 [Pyrenophora tritici-repentis]EDU46744.1 predicted protein [Pyrenophora tritici-repentis Pt-1C-BFP]KAF7571900.1 hypothetical protein PtrM4_094000 [Pyrenophora tritici-repentis]KAG9384909.1 hypothetical protein A1F94_004456 [Pyrenophora tritici-repentis]KAI0584531.1 hypothetical protein Alg215_03010 [Pyrenophora tritici-repentis]
MNYFDMWAWLFRVRNDIRHTKKSTQTTLNRKAAQKATVGKVQEALAPDTQASTTDEKLDVYKRTGHILDNYAASLQIEAETISAVTELATQILKETPTIIDKINNNLPNSIAHYNSKRDPVPEHPVTDIDQEISSFNALYDKLMTTEVKLAVLGAFCPSIHCARIS